MASTIRKILYLLPQGDRLKLIYLFVMMLFAALFEVVGIGMIPAFVSAIATPQKVLEVAQLGFIFSALGIETSGDLLVHGAILLILVFFCKNIFLLFYRYIETKFVWGRFMFLGNKLFEHYMAASYEFHLNRNTSELLRNITQEARYVINNVLTPILKLTMDAVLVFGIFAMLLWIDPIITLLASLLLGGAGGIFLKVIREKTSKYGKAAQNDRAMMIRDVNEGLGGIKDVRVLNREKWFNDRFSNHIKSYKESQIYRAIASQANKPIIETIAVTGMLCIALVLYWQGSDMEIIIPMLALFGAATVRLMPAIREIVSAVTNLRYYVHTVDPLFNDVMELKKSYSKSIERTGNNYNFDYNSKQQANTFEADIHFKNVSYSYPDSEVPAIKYLSLRIPKGQVVGFAGASGAGKTTLVDLLLGLLIPQVGSIQVDGIDIHSNIGLWQRNIGYIPQFIFLADNTIKRNIAFGLPDEKIEDEKLWSAIEVAQLTDLIDELPKGIDTVIGEQGTRLSGGQRQRIGIARALYHNPEVLVMDEATSSLDNITEKFVVDAIERLRGERTIIMIAHRLSTVQNCDRICLMKKGKLIDSGTYSELLEKNNEFRAMSLIDE